MTTEVRLYKSEQGARDVDARLQEEGFENRAMFLPSDHAGREVEAVNAAIESGVIPERFVKLCQRSLKEGKSLIAAQAPFGSGTRVISILESDDSVDNDLIRRYGFRSPSPLSEVLGIPVLSKFESSTGLLNSDWSFSSKFGMGLLSRNPAPLSSMIGWRPLSGRKKNWTRSWGFPLLSRNPAPLSSLFGMATVTKSKGAWTSSFGMPLLSRNPAPFSSLFGMKVLSEERTSARVATPQARTQSQTSAPSQAQDTDQESKPDQ